MNHLREKIPSVIAKLSLNDASYENSGASITPTLINLFFGNNGTGKSTIGKAIKNNSGTIWTEGKSADDYVVHVYNQEYIESNFQNYYNLPGVFTINEVNISIMQQINAKRVEKAQAEADLLKAKQETMKKYNALKQALEAFQKKCWEKTAAVRRDFDKTQEKCKTKQNFANKVLSIKVPTEHDIEKLSRLYSAAYAESARKYEEFSQVSSCSALDSINGNEILSLSIVNAGSTPFAQFMQALKATEWVQQGHLQFHLNSNGKCPYCQQELPSSFENDIRSAFDVQYQQMRQTLSGFYEAYRAAANELIVPLQKLPDTLMSGINIVAYNDKLSAIKGIISSNIQQIKDKIDTPSIIVELESLETPLRELSDLIESYNKLIRENNSVIDAKHQNQAECTTFVWEHIAWLLSEEVTQYETSKKALEEEERVLQDQWTNLDIKVGELTNEISALSKNSVNTSATIESVNMLLRDSGFQGFSIREKQDVPNVYEIIRPNGMIATNLSEGERNFIAFLYFYHQVKGSELSDGIQRDKVVVIDDPVSSMDSGSLFIVSSLVREMIEICENNAVGGDPIAKGNFIKQIFILTHNSYFHREISYNRVKNYEYVNFYLISKIDNKSTIRLCVKTNPEIMTEQINFNPVQNSYAALWEEYKVLESSIPLMSVIRRILEYYFLQLCGYDGVTLRTCILKDNKDKFITKDENGNEDYRPYQMASAMLSYICASNSGVNDGINFVDDCVDVAQIKETFKQIFYLMNQIQHYDMMMGNQ